MPDTYAYKVRDRGGNLITGTLVADNEALVLQRLREHGLHARSRSAGDRGSRDRDQRPAKKKVKLKELAGLLAAVRHDGELGPADPARARDPWRADRATRSSPKVLGEVRAGRRAGVLAVGGDGRSTRRSSTTCSSRWSSRARRAASSTTSCCRLADMIENEVKLRGKIKSAMTYPIAVVALVS